MADHGKVFEDIPGRIENDQLSERGRRGLQPNPMMKLIMQVWGNLYNKETNPDGIISLGVAENNLLQPELAEYFTEKSKITPFDLTYGDSACGSKELLKTLEGFLNKRFNPVKPVKAEEIITLSGVSAVIDHFAYVLANPGEGFLIGKPLYGGFINDLTARAEVKPVLVSMKGVDPLGLDCIARYEDALIKAEASGTKIRALILCNPHNPLGKCYSVEVIEAIMRFCAKYSIHLISDEVYAFSIYDTPGAVGFKSILAIPPQMPEDLIHVTYGASKDFCSGGLRLGLIHTRNKKVWGALMSIAFFCRISSSSDQLWRTIIQDEAYLDNFFKRNSAELGKARDRIEEWLNRNKVPYVGKTNAGFFIWADFSEYLPPKSEVYASDIDRERKLSQALIDGGVYMASGEMFGGEEPGWFRITFANPPEELALGLKRLEKILEKFRKEDVYSGVAVGKLSLQ